MKISYKRIGIELSILGAFIFSYYLRSIVMPSNWVNVNCIAIFGVLILFWHYGKQFFKNKNQIIVLISILIMSMLFAMTEIKNHYSGFYALKCWTALVLPIFLIFVKIEINDFNKILKFFMKCLNSLVYVMFLMLVIDMLTGKAATIFFANISRDATLLILAQKTSRFCSIIGHYIPTAQVYLVYYIFNMIIYRCGLKKSNSLLITLVALIGIAMTASKTSILAMLILVVLFNFRNFKGALGSIIVLIIAYFAGVFNLVLNRLLTTELSTGRNSTWILVLSRISDLFPIIIGHGTSSVFKLNETSGISWASAAFEYPFRHFSYEIGVIFTIILFYVAFIMPLLFLIKNKNYQLASITAILMFVVNTYNGIACYMDFFWQYCIYIFIIINMSNHYNMKTIFKVQRKKVRNK